jgi:hypothetical protein
MTPQVLTLAEVKAKGREYYEKGMLTAQGPNPECEYVQSTGHRCVVGAALNDKLAQYMVNHPSDNNQMVNTISNLIRISPDSVLIKALQDAHDSWATAVSEEQDEDVITYRKNKFLDLLYA